MKKIVMILVSIVCISWQLPGIGNINSTYAKLMDKSVGEVMKTLKISAKDTVGKTGPIYVGSVKPENLYYKLPDKLGNLLCFKNNKLSVIVPK